jgi:hypothetical protein
MHVFHTIHEHRFHHNNSTVQRRGANIKAWNAPNADKKHMKQHVSDCSEGRMRY